MKRIIATCLCLAAAAILCLGTVARAEPVKAAFVLLATIDDQGWTTTHYNGIEYLQRKLGDAVEVAYTENVFSPADAERVIRDYAQQGYDIIFTTTFLHMDPTLTVAMEYPDIFFSHCSGYKSADNMGNYFVRMYQAEYLAGYMSGLMGLSNVGTVATHPIPEVVRGINAFTLGLIRGLEESSTSYDENAVNTVVWLNEWRDPINETTLAEALATRGHDLIRQMADTPDSSKAACGMAVPAIGYGTDASQYGADCALVSTMFNWGSIYTRQVEAVINGTWEPTAYWGGFEDNGVMLSDFSPSVPDDVREKVLAEKARFEAGEDNVFLGPLFNQAGEEVIAADIHLEDGELLSMGWFVKGVSGTLP